VKDAAVGIVVDGVSVVQTIVTEAFRIGDRGAHVVPHVAGELSPG